MDRPRHDPADLERLKDFTVPTLANAIETFGAIPLNEGSCDVSLKCIFPRLPMMVGYAVTARISTDQPTSDVRPGISEHDYWRWVASRPGPKVAVVQDIDKPPKGAMWGEWNSNVYKALGCVGTVTDGAVRDFEGVEKLGFHFFATATLPTHGNGVYIDYSGPVRVAGLTFRPGDLLAGDQHGIILIPEKIDLKELARVAAEIDRLESEIFAFCQSKDFDVEGLARLDASVMSRWPKPTAEAHTTVTR